MKLGDARGQLATSFAVDLAGHCHSDYDTSPLNDCTNLISSDIALALALDQDTQTGNFSRAVDRSDVLGSTARPEPNRKASTTSPGI